MVVVGKDKKHSEFKFLDLSRIYFGRFTPRKGFLRNKSLNDAP
jgi:hypothetical protein